MHRGRQGGGLRPHAAPGAALAELGPARQAEDDHARPPRPDRERAVRPGVRLESAGPLVCLCVSVSLTPADFYLTKNTALQDVAHRDHVQPATALVDPERGRLHLHRPGRWRTPERLLRPERHATQGPAHGKHATQEEGPAHHGKHATQEEGPAHSEEHFNYTSTPAGAIPQRTRARPGSP